VSIFNKFFAKLCPTTGKGRVYDLWVFRERFDILSLVHMYIYTKYTVCNG